MYFSLLGNLQSFDNYWFLLINTILANKLFDHIMPVASDLDKWMPLLVVVWLAVMVWGKKRGRIIASVALVMVIITDQVSAGILKPLIERTRPCNVLPGVHLFFENNWITTSKLPVLEYVSSSSFPSNHAANIVGQAVFWARYFVNLAPIFYLLAIVVCYSRIYMGLHYPSDVIGGMVIGVLAAKALHYPLDRVLGEERFF
jgi:undecaprenyl-diphosphatase